MMGVYILVAYNNKERELNVGKYGRIKFKPGYYAFMDYAKKDLFKKLSRLFSKRKGKQWYMDFILNNFKAKLIYYTFTSNEICCEIARNVNLKPIKEFKCNLNRCNTHLFYSENLSTMKKSIEECLRKLNITYRVLFC